MTTTLIAKRTRVGGRVDTEGDVVVEGRIEGTIIAAGTVTVGNTGVAVSDIQAGRVVVLGIVIGNTIASERVDVASSARIVGDVHAPIVSVAPPAIIEGRIESVAEAPPPVAPAEVGAASGGAPPVPGSQKPTLRIRGAPVVRPARPDAMPPPSPPPEVEAPRPPPAHAAGDAGSPPRLRRRDPNVVPVAPRPTSRVRMTPRRVAGL